MSVFYLDRSWEKFLHHNFKKVHVNNPLFLRALGKLYKFLDIEDAEIYDFYLNNILTKSINENKISKIFKNFKI